MMNFWSAFAIGYLAFLVMCGNVIGIIWGMATAMGSSANFPAVLSGVIAGAATAIGIAGHFMRNL